MSMEPFLEMVTYFNELPDDRLPSVLSISYGANEQLFPKEYAKQVCNLLGQLGARGVSVIASSGNQGPGISCQSNDGKNTTRFLPSFPATCPYVTAVGATTGIAPEKAVYFSSGGFSEYWLRPWWQYADVKTYLNAHGKEWSGYYNPYGRGMPDISLQGDVIFPFFARGTEHKTGGTR